MSDSSIDRKTQLILMGKAAGKCTFRGCNKCVVEEVLTKKRVNLSNFAHIIADSPNGPRGDAVLSERLKSAESNLMVMCRDHHKLIDDDENTYTVGVLKEMKKEHEEYIEKLLKIKQENKVLVVKYTFSIADRPISISDADINTNTFKENMYPDEIIDLSGCSYDETNIEGLFELESKNIKRLFDEKVKPKLDRDCKQKVFLYGMASQALLIYLGTLFSEVTTVEVQQLQREPKEWYLSNETDNEVTFKVEYPEKKSSKVALNISVTGDISEERIRAVTGEDCDIVKIESNIHGRDIIKSKKDLENYRITIREVFEKIKDEYGRDCEINIFPAMPISIAVETGRCWMKKVDSTLTILDERNGFKKVLKIEYGGED